MQQDHLLLYPRERSRIQRQKIPKVPDSPLLRQVSPRCYRSTREGFNLLAALDNSALRQGFEFLLVLLAGFTAAMSFPGSEDVIRFFADEELAGTVEDRFIALGLDFATLLSSPFLFLRPLRHLFGAAYQAGILSAASRAETADVEQMMKIVPFVTCEITFGQHVCELMFGSNVPDLNLGIQICSVKQHYPEQLCGFLTHVSLWDFDL